MKKITCILLSLTIGISASFAQAKPQSKAVTHSQTAASMSAPPQSASQATPAQASPAAQGATKKDGTPDMRHKANKEAKKPAQKLKKDGTPDMRYKENKQAAGK